MNQTLFQGMLYHSGMIDRGLIISKGLDQGQKGGFSQISIISENGEEENYLDRNETSYFRFTSGPVNHTMAIDSVFHLYLFQYEKNTMKRTKISIDPETDTQGTEPFYVGDGRYLVTSTLRGGIIKLYLVHLNGEEFNDTLMQLQ